MSSQYIDVVQYLEEVIEECLTTVSRSYAWGMLGWIRTVRSDRVLSVTVERNVLEMLYPKGHPTVDFYAPVFAAVAIEIAAATQGSVVDVTERLKQVPNNVALDPIYHYLVYSTLTLSRHYLAHSAYMAVYSAVSVPLQLVGLSVRTVRGAVALVKARL
jgi:hypothetical protein